MAKLLTAAQANDQQEPAVHAAGSQPARAGADEANGTVISTVMFLEIVDYAKKSVTGQLKAKERFNSIIADAIDAIPPQDRIVFDTGNGAAIDFLGEPHDALVIASEMARVFALAAADAQPMNARIGVNLGPVRLVYDSNDQPSIIGDGIHVAERVMSLAGPGQVLVSGAFRDAIAKLSDAHALLFAYQGARTDHQVREHEIYEVIVDGESAASLPRPATVATRTETAARRSITANAAGRGWLSSPKVAYGAAAASVVMLAIAVVSYVVDSPAPPAHVAVSVAATAPVPQTTAAAPSPGALAQQPIAAEPLHAAAAPTSQIEVASPSRPEAAPRVPSKAAGAVRRPSPRTIPAPKATEPTVADAGSSKAINDAWKTPTGAQDKDKTAALALAPTGVAPTTPPKSAARPTALITLAISPWGEVFVDGVSTAVSPPISELELAPGSHRIEIRNGDFKPYLETLQLEANQTVRIRHKFAQR